MSEVENVKITKLSHDMVNHEVTIRVEAEITFEPDELARMPDADSYEVQCAIKGSVRGPNPFLHRFDRTVRFKKSNAKTRSEVSWLETIPAADLDVGPGRDRIFANVYLWFLLLADWDPDAKPKKGTSERMNGWFGGGTTG